jgi:ABC-type transport system involved in multi-copper enzyme maturation permease subunit
MRVSGHILAIALNTFRETVRAQVLYVLIGAGLVTIAVSTVLAPVALGENVRITKDIGLTTIDALGLMIVTFLGTTIVYKEIERRTIMVLLSKPIHRYEFVLGKFVGLSMTLALVVAVETLFLVVAVKLASGGFDPRLLGASAMAFLMLVTINAVAVCYTSFAGPMVAAFLTLATFMAGRLADQLADFATQQGLPALKVFFYLLPNLASMDVRAEVVHGVAFDWPGVALAVLHGLSYTTAALCFAVLMFRGRQFR